MVISIRYTQEMPLMVYGMKNDSFTISRVKFNSNYLFEEIHWDANTDFGTVKPIKEIEKSPFTTLKEDGILEYLNGFEKRE